EDGSLEAVDPGELRDLGVGQRADSRDRDVGRQRALAGLDLPALVRLIPAHRLDLMIEAQVVLQALARHHSAHVVPDLLLGRERPAPAGVLLLGPGVENAGDVTRTAGVRVVPPGPPKVARALEHDEVVHASLL